MNFAFSPLIALVYVYTFLVHLAPSLSYPEFTPGDVWPELLEIDIGSNANITCRMNLTAFDGNSSSLYFIEADTKKNVSKSDITIINSTSIVYKLRHALEQDRKYRCLRGDGKAIADSHVIVGTPPMEIKEFKCRGFNYKYMVCNFTIPHNTLAVNYDLEYRFASPQYKHVCELEKFADGKYCNMTQDGRIPYASHYEYYNFTLTGSNTLGKRTQHFLINNFESVIPPRPDIRLIEVNNDSARFEWNMRTYLYEDKGVTFNISLTPDKFDRINDNQIKKHTYKHDNGYGVKISNLPYAFYYYTLSIRMRVNSSREDEDLWSETGVFRFQTSSCLPDAPPKTDVSSFYLLEGRVRLYWEQRPFYRENGANFHYSITKVLMDDLPVDLNPIEIDRTSALFPWDRKHKFEFEIRSSNNRGYSKESSRIVVPSQKSLMDYTPDWRRSIYSESKGTYTLSWNSPANQSNLIDYTVYWCFSKPVHSNECDDTINFTHIGKNTTQYTTEFQQKEHPIIFAVSANYMDFTTGLHWTMCTAEESIDLIEMVPEFMISSREIDVHWNDGLICTSILDGYNLTICLVEDVESGRCLYNATTFTIAKNVKSHSIRGLTPHTAYKVEMYMYSEMKRGKPSAPKFLITPEEAPSPPRDLKCDNVTRHSVLLAWSPPLEMNGILRSYIIFYCIGDAKRQCQSSVVASELQSYKLENLNNYTNYTVYVVANTTDFSKPSEEVHFKTLVGRPSKPQKTSESNDTKLQWTQGNNISERVDFYEVSIHYFFKDKKIQEHIYGVINATSCDVNIPSCISKDYTHLVYVRAVTAAFLNESDWELINENSSDNSLEAVYFTKDTMLRCRTKFLTENQQLKQWRRFHDSNRYILYKSDWAMFMTYNCADIREWFMAFMYVGVLIVMISLILIFRIIYQKYKHMSGIDVHLPSGLAYIDNIGERGPIKVRDDELCIRKSENTCEHKHLLKSDSGYLGENSDVAAIGVSTPPISLGISSGYDGSDRSVNYDQSDDINNMKPQHSSPIDDAYSLMQAPKYNPELLQNQRMISTSNYVKPNKLCTVSEDFDTTSLASDTAINLSSMPRINSRGYVETRERQMPVNPAACGIYTTPDAFHLKATSPPSGYVTPKELLALGNSFS